MPGDRVYLVDASVYVFRAWHAWRVALVDGEGNPTHALYGFARLLTELLERVNPGRIAVAFDECHGRGHRHRLYPPYKGNREAAPLALQRQFALCRDFCRALGVAEFASPEFEADDLIGTLASACRAEGLAVTILSCDKDLAQLIGPADIFWDYAEGRQYHYPEIATRFGVIPERMADYLALRGDSVDNVPGVPGIGPKTAAALMQTFASLEELFAAPADVARLPLRGAARLPERLQQHRDMLFLARTLTRICCDVPLGADSAALLRRAPDLSLLGAFCANQGFGPMLLRQAERLARPGAALAFAAMASDTVASDSVAVEAAAAAAAAA
ncbi:MAG TPA: 5'-3' exonuclease H3TH domain-containing protein [Steroidobacteraceae bacterium]|nr:5'-3' exonuclease H3TH domain-containing protein [Steroidobacteraceae bacterium]